MQNTNGQRGKSIADRIIIVLPQRRDDDIETPLKDVDIAAAVGGKLAHVQNVLCQLVKQGTILRPELRHYRAARLPAPGPFTATGNSGEPPQPAPPDDARTCLEAVASHFGIPFTSRSSLAIAEVTRT